jgi:hypothetical protein
MILAGSDGAVSGWSYPMTQTRPEENRSRIEETVRFASLQLREIGLENGGSLVLEGDAYSVVAKKLSLERAAALSGVKGIVDRLHLVLATPMGDGEIHVDLRDALISDRAFESFEIREHDVRCRMN